jgi:hypothetical protein
MKRLVSLGNYSMRTMMKSAKGPFNITMTNVVAEGNILALVKLYEHYERYFSRIGVSVILTQRNQS